MNVSLSFKKYVLFFKTLEHIIKNKYNRYKEIDIMESKNETAKLNTDKNIYNKAHSGQTIKDIAINKK